MIDFLDLASGVAAGFGVVLAIYSVVWHGEKMMFGARLGLMLVCAGVIMNTPKQLVGWVDTPGGEWTYVVSHIGIALFLWAVIWPQMRKSTHLFSR